MTGAAPPRPPGSMGLPLIGETPAFLANLFRFLEVRQRRHGNVFKSSALGRKIVFLAGTEGAEAFYDPGNISRTDAHPFPLVDLFGGINMEMYDGPRHFALKSMALSAFDHAAIAGYLPGIQRLVEATLERLAAAGEFSAVAELRRLAIEAICGNVMGLEPGAATAAITRDYGLVLTGILSLPVPLPGTAYAKARAARDRLLERIRGVIAERRARPGGDGLSRMLTATAADGRTFTDEEAALELHHIVIAGFIVYALMAEAMRRLAERPELRERCAREVREHAASGPLSMDALARLELCTQVILEAKRTVPLVPLAFGRARRTFTCGGFEVPEGWTVYLALWLNNRDPAIYREPERFDPDRFAPPRAEHRRHPMAFIPQGAEPPTGHRCLGLDYSTFLSVAFVALLLRGYEWELPPQDLDYDWKGVPPVPRGGLRVRLSQRTRDAPARPGIPDAGATSTRNQETPRA
jgi:retinoid hydroxylase